MHVVTGNLFSTVLQGLTRCLFPGLLPVLHTESKAHGPKILRRDVAIRSTAVPFLEALAVVFWTSLGWNEWSHGSEMVFLRLLPLQIPEGLPL